MIFDAASRSLPGTRPINEDSFGIFFEMENRLYVLCDGLGGHGQGEVASSLVVDSLGKAFKDLALKGHGLKRFLPLALEEAQRELLGKQQAEHAVQAMKTTVVAMLSDGKKAYIAHVGDSRLYAFAKGKVLFRTQDHSIPQMLALTGEIREEEIRHHKQRSMLLRVMGSPWTEPAYELHKPFPLRKADAFLLCSDGFWELIEESDMERLLGESFSPRDWLYRMQYLVEQNGAGREMDNYSAIAIMKRKDK